MSKLEPLRALIRRRLCAAADEIFTLLERTMREREEEFSRRYEQTVLHFRSGGADIQHLLLTKKEIPAEQQVWSPGLDPQTEDGTEPEPSPLQSAARDTSYSTEVETEDSCDWEASRDPRSGLDPLKTREEPSNDEQCEPGSVGSTECAQSVGQKELWKKQEGRQAEAKPFSCSICDKAYPRKNSLRCHMRLHLEGKRFSCSVCNKTFQWKRDVAMHMRVHTGEKPYSCSFCLLQFARKEDRKRHLIVHTGEKPFGCSVCGKRFARRAHLKRHSDTVHMGE